MWEQRDVEIWNNSILCEIEGNERETERKNARGMYFLSEFNHLTVHVSQKERQREREGETEERGQKKWIDLWEEGMRTEGREEECEAERTQRSVNATHSCYRILTHTIPSSLSLSLYLSISPLVCLSTCIWLWNVRLGMHSCVCPGDRCECKIKLTNVI